MTDHEWQTCPYPDLLLEHLIGTIRRQELVEFVRQCWDRVAPYVPAGPHEETLVEAFERCAPRQSDFDAATYAAEAALKAARWAPDLQSEQRAQAEILRRLVRHPDSRTAER